VSTAPGAEGIAIAPDGRSAYVCSVTPGAVSQYSINPTTGRLTPKSPAAVDTGFGSHSLAIAPDGKSAYVVTVPNNKISQYRINPSTGALSSKPASTAATVLHPEAIAIAADGKSAYVTSENKGQVSQYTISPTTGEIAPMSPATVATTSGAFGVAVSPYADLSATTSGPAPVNHRSTLTVAISDRGPSNAWQVAAADRLPAATRFLTASATGGHCSGPPAETRGATVRCHLGRLKNGGVWRIRIKVVTSGDQPTRGRLKLTSVTPHSL
jgi:uncharacterized repeat protein (TIGR01451 family)